MSYRCNCLTKAGERCKNKIIKGRFCHLHKKCESPVTFKKKKVKKFPSQTQRRRSRTRSKKRRANRSRSKSQKRIEAIEIGDSIVEVPRYNFKENKIPSVKKIEIVKEERLPSVKKLPTIKPNPKTVKKETVKLPSVKENLGSTPTKQVNKGLELMLKMGYKIGEPLGIRGKGILEPVKAIEQSSFAVPAKIKN